MPALRKQEYTQAIQATQAIQVAVSSLQPCLSRPKSGILPWLGVAVVVAAAAAFFAAQQGMIALPSALSPVERQIDRLSEVVIPTATSLEPVATLTTRLRDASTSVAENAPKAQATIDAGARTGAKAVSDALSATEVNAVATTATPLATTTPSTSPSAPPAPAIVPTATPLPSPHLRYLEEKQYMLALINAARIDAGVPPVELGDNTAAQLHAESALANCFSSHWGIDGLKPYMRYSLAGGYQSNGENGHGSDYCIKASDRYTALHSVNQEIDDAVEGWMNSPGHRKNILDRLHKKVNIGLAWDRYNFLAYQHFEGDYVEYDELPSLDANGLLSISGATKNGVRFRSKRDLGVQIYFDPPPHELTRGQVSRTYCYDNGRQVAALREPLTGNSRWTTDKYSRTFNPCPDPYDVSPSAPPASSHSHANRLWQEAYNASRNQNDQTIVVPWITALRWTAVGESFSVEADIGGVLAEHGAGVYRIMVWGDIDGERAVISEYSIFHGITPPDTYARTPAVIATAMSAPTPIVEPQPDELPPIEVETTVEGYYADGTAKVRLQITLRADADFPPMNFQAISVSCTQEGEPIGSCDTTATISPVDGQISAATELTLRIPMGLASVSIDYGGEEPYELSVYVPERILGVDRETWECYSDRSVSNNSEGFNGCYGWYSPTVEKWRSGSTVRVWATGNDNYIRAFRETLDEQLAPVLNLTFEWVEDEKDADYVAILGVSESDERPDRWANCPHAWGCGGPIDVKGGEVRKADLIVYHFEEYDRFLDDYPTLKRFMNGVFIHEALHGLAPTGHADRSNVVLSVMRSAGYLTSIDKAILSLNSHPLIEPGMAMSQVEPLIVFKDELIDPPQEPEPTPYDLLDRTLATLQEVDTVRMKIKGGWSGGRCDSRFGKRQWATLEIAGFDAPDDPRLAHLQDGGDKFFIFHSGKPEGIDGDGWHHYWQRSGNDWRLINREELWDSTAWWVRNSKLHHTITELLWYYDEDAVEMVNRSNGEITLSAQYNPSETSPHEPTDKWLTLNMVIDEDSYEVKRFEWIHHDREWDYCNAYTEEGIDLEYGVDIEIPNAIVESSNYALPAIRTNRE